MPKFDPSKKKKKDEEEERYTDTATGNRSSSTVSITKPGGGTLNLDANKKKTTTTVSTAKVEKPGSSKTSNKVTSYTDTGTGGKNSSTAAKKSTEVLKKGVAETQKISDELTEQIDMTAAKLKAQQETGTKTNRRTDHSSSPTSLNKRSKNYTEPAKKDESEGFNYTEYVLNAKRRQKARAEAELSATRQRIKDADLVTWDLDAKEKELAAYKDLVDLATNTDRQNKLLNDAYKAGGAGSEQYLSAVRQIEQAKETTEQNALAMAQLKDDIARAKDLQWNQKYVSGVAAIVEKDPQLGEHLRVLSGMRRSGEPGEATTQDSGNWDVNPETVGQKSEFQQKWDAAYDAVYKRLTQMGYTAKDVEELIEGYSRLEDAKTAEAAHQRDVDFANKHPVAASLIARGSNIFSGLGSVDLLAQKVFHPDRPVNWNSEYLAPSNTVSDITQQVTQDIMAKAPNAKVGQTYAFLYQTGMSMLDSGVNMLLGAAGLPESIGLTILGGSAATMGMKEAHERGLNDNQALSLGLLSGAIEYATEKIGLDQFLETLSKGGSRSLVSNLLRNALAEGGEEVASDLANLLTDQIITEGKSEFRQKIQSYRDMGYSDSEAAGLAAKDQIKDTALSFLGGALSGGLMGGGAVAYNHLVDNHSMDMIYAGRAAEVGTPVHTAAEQLYALQAELGTMDESELTDGYQEIYQQAKQELQDTLNALPSKEKTELLKEGRKQRRQEVKNYRDLQKYFEKDSWRTGEYVPEETTVYSENATVQKAAEKVATGNRRQISQAVTEVFKNREAQSSLGLELTDDMTKPAQRVQIQQALEALVNGETRQENGETAAVSAQIEDSEEYQKFSKMYGEANPGASEEEKRVAFDEYKNDSFVADGEIWTKERFKEEYKRRNPNATDAEIETRFQQVKTLSQESLASKEQTGYNSTETQAVAAAKEENNGEKVEESTAQTESGTEAAGTRSAGELAGRAGEGSGGADQQLRGGAEGAAETASDGRNGHRGVDQRKDNGKRKVQKSVRGEKKSAGAGTGTGNVLQREGNENNSGGATGRSEGSGGVRSVKQSRNAKNANEAERVRGLNLKVRNMTLEPGAPTARVVANEDVPAEYKHLLDLAKKLNLKIRFILGNYTTIEGQKVPAWQLGRTIVVSLDSNYRNANELFLHEFTHAAFERVPGLRDAVLKNLLKKGIDEDTLFNLAHDNYLNYEKYYGALTKENAHLFIDEFLCDAYAGVQKKGVTDLLFNKARKTITLEMDRGVNKVAEALGAESTKKYFDIDEDDIPDWAFGEEVDEEDYTDLYDDVLPEDKHPDVKKASINETGDETENKKYYEDSGKDDAPSGLSPEDVIYDPDQLAYYDKASGRLVIYDESSQTFFYDEFGDVFGDEEPGALPENKIERAPTQNAPAPGYKEGETAVGDVQPTRTDTTSFREWFNDPTKNHELSASRRSKKPKTLFHGSESAGFTRFMLTRGGSTMSGGIYLTDDINTASDVYAKNEKGGGPREFKPIVAKSWEEATHFARKDLGMRLEQDDDGYTLYAYNEKTGMFDEKATFTPDEAGLQSFNDTYGEAHNGVQTPGVYRLYGTSQNALVIDAHGRGWQYVLYDPVGRSVDSKSGPLASKWWSTDDLVDRAFASGYDCIIIKNVAEGAGFLTNDYVFKDPGQVKSVYNVGTWDRNNPDMRYFDEDEEDWGVDAGGIVSYDAKAGTVTLEGKKYTVAEFKYIIPELWDDYTDSEMYEIQKSLADQGFKAGMAFSKKNKTPYLQKDSAEYSLLVNEYIAHESRTTKPSAPGFSKDYGAGDRRGLDWELVIYDEAYDNDNYPTPFFERSTGKPVYYNQRYGSGVFLYDEVREILSAENPELLKVLEDKSHFSDFYKDEYDTNSPMLKRNESVPRKLLSEEEKRGVARDVKRKRGVGSYAKNLYDWFHDPTETKELTGALGEPLILYHGSYLAGYTKNYKTKLRRRGFFATQNPQIAAYYSGGQDIEFVPRHLNGWDEAEVFINEELGMYLAQEDQAYNLWSINPETGELDLRRTYEATDAGLQELNDTYGNLYTEAAMDYGASHPGTYRVYGTSDKAFVIDLSDGSRSGGGNWMEVLFNPTGLIANPLSKHGNIGFWDTDDLADFLFSQDYDCVIVKHVRDGGNYDNNDYIFRDPGQVKSIYNVGTWDRNNPDMRYFDEDDNEIEPPDYTFDEQVDMTLAGTLDRHIMAYTDENGNKQATAVYVSYETPESLQAINMPALPLLMTQRHVRDINHPRKEDANGKPLPGYEHYHGIQADLLKRLPDLLAEPAMLIKVPATTKNGRTSGDIIVVTTAKDDANRQVIVTIHPAGRAVYNGVEGPANFITSMYGLGPKSDTIRGYIALAATQGRVMYANKEKSQAIMAPTGEVGQFGSTSAQAKDGFNLPSPTSNRGNSAPEASTHNSRAFDQLDFDTIIQSMPDAVNPERLQRRFFDESEDGPRPDTFESLLARAEAVYGSAIQQAAQNPAPVSPATRNDEVMMAWIIARRNYGSIPQTGTNYRGVNMPARTAPDNKVSKTPSTVMGAEVTPDRRLMTVADAVMKGKFSYIPISDKLAENRARAKIAKDGFQDARVKWTKAISEGKVNKDLVAMGATLLNNAANSEASGKEFVGILTDYTDLLRSAGQALQAAKILKKLSPEGKLYAAQQQVDRINEELARRGLDPTHYPGVTIDQELIDAYRRAKTDAERDEIMTRIAQNIADQIPPTFMDKFTAWRYLAMLGNLRTQVRNILGNTAMQPMRMLKADIAGLTEALIQGLGGNIDRTTSVLRDGETFKAAFEDYKSVREYILGGGKYDDNRRFTREIEEKRRIFKFKPLEWYRKATNWAMDQGDSIFCSFTYADALARYIKANKATWSTASEELKDKARQFAIKEAAEATYRDNNAFSNLIVRARIRNPDNAVKKVAAAVVEGVLPFRKTPANILVRTVEYSPLGLLRSAYSAATKAVGKNNVTGAEIVNQMAKGLTGSGLLALGFALASTGFLVGKAPDDDKEKEAWKREGHQAYSLEIDGTSYTLDWMAPTCVPLFLGANMVDAFMEEGITLDSALSALNTISDPVLEMSMLQGIQNLIDNAANYGDDSALVRLTTDAIWSYVSQVVPTFLGQAERAYEDTRMQTYTDKNSGVPTDWQYAMGKMSAKVPGLDYAQLVYTDAWGRTQTDTDNTTLHVLSQFLSPGYFSEVKTSAMEEELTRLYKATGNKSVLINNADRKIEYTWEDVQGNKHEEKKDLTGAEYLTYNTTRGQTAYRVLTELTKSSEYKKLSDDEKAEAVAKVYTYATQVGKKKVASKYEQDAWVQLADRIDLELGWSEAEFIMNYNKYGSAFFVDNGAYDKTKAAIEGGIALEDYVAYKRNASTDDKSAISKEEAVTYLENSNFTREQKALLITLTNKGWNNPYA